MYDRNPSDPSNFFPLVQSAIWRLTLNSTSLSLSCAMAASKQHSFDYGETTTVATVAASSLT